MIDQLQKFKIPQSVSIVLGNGGLPLVWLEHRSGASAEIYLYGAHVTSWVNAEGDELFFTSEKSSFEKGKAIRAGIPFCFPQFAKRGSIELMHGFARFTDWELAETKLLPSHEVEAAFRLRESEQTLAIWPHRFEVEYRVTLNEKRLSVGVTITNPGDAPYDFALALHTYFAVGDIKNTLVKGLKGATYADSLRDNVREVEQREAIAFDQETDRVYVSAPNKIEIEDKVLGRTIMIAKENLPDAVVWNPWIAKSLTMPDIGPEEYLRFVCVESGIMDSKITLPAGERYLARTVFSYR